MKIPRRTIRIMVLCLAMFVLVMTFLVFTSTDKYDLVKKGTNRRKYISFEEFNTKRSPTTVSSGQDDMQPLKNTKPITKKAPNTNSLTSIKQSTKLMHVTDATPITKTASLKGKPTWDMFYDVDKNKFKKDPELKYFIPRMSQTDRKDMLMLYDTFARTCEKANLVHFLWGGSLLGAYRHHGIIPWDDDFDVVMNSSERQKIQYVLSNVSGFKVLSPSPKVVQWKFYKDSFPPIPGKQFKWPFIDLFFFNESSTHISGVTGSIKRELKHKKEDILPLRLRLFENRYVPVPHKMDSIIEKWYGTKKCVSVKYLHKECRSTTSTNIPCSRLYKFFPFVFRKKEHSGNITETLQRGNKTLMTISVRP